MAVIQKTLFPKNLDKFAVLVNDVQSDSKYFKITELSDTFTGGKNAFLIAGSEQLVPDTRIQIELKDSAGNIIYHEPGEGLISSSINGESFTTEYYEGVSKVVAVYVYPDTAYGPCTLTILGELSEYEDDNGILTPVPFDWENKYNVKWQKQIDVNPSLANTTKIRFYQRPTATITELLSPLYRIENDIKVASNVTQSFANIKLSRLETFAGDVKRVKVFRTSEGDISDYDLIQDILIESKELLTSYGLSGSVIGNTGTFTSETLKNYWNTGSLNAYLTSSRVESGLRLTGSGYLTYTTSLDLKSSNTYELNLDAFYSSSSASNLEIYLSSGSVSSSIGTLYGIQPTKNLLDTVIPFKIDNDYPTASLYFSQSQGEWHIGNVSLRLSQDTAFSPDEISFVTTMPTVLGNETFNFKFEFYDVNNNYVPVEVTQSALFTGGNNNINGTLTLISSSTSQSLAELYAVSSSISGTIVVTSGSISGSLTNVSSSVSGTIASLSSSVSSSNTFILSSSLSKVQQLANGQYSGSFIGDTVIYSPTIGGQQGYISKLFTVGDTSAARINLDARNTSDGAPDNLRKIWIGTQPYGYHNNSNTAVYLDSAGKFSLGNKLNWNGSALSISGEVVITSGTTYDTITSTQSTANTASTNANTALGRVVSSVGGVTFNPAPSGTGLFINAQRLGYYDGGSWKTYMQNNGDFYLNGTNGYLIWSSAASTLSIRGDIVATNISATTAGNIAGWGINATTLGTSRLKLNSSRPAMEIYDAGGAIVVDISTASSLSDKSAGSISPSPSSLASSGDRSTIYTNQSYTSRYSVYASFIDDDIYFGPTTSTFTLSAGNPLIGRLCSVSSVVQGMNTLQFTAAGDDFTITTYITNMFLSCQVGFRLTAPDGSITYATITNTAEDTSTHLGDLTLYLTPTGTVSTSVVLQQGTYTITPFISNLQAVATLSNTTQNPATFAFGALTPYISLITAQVPVSKTEMIAGGFQVVYDTARYISIPRANNVDFVQIGGGLTCTGDVTANTSDRRLKENIRIINNPLEKIENIRGVYFNYTDEAKLKTGYTNEEEQVGFIAQEVQLVLPHIVKPAPFDKDQSTGKSISGENYLTIQYEKIVPLLLEGIKELKREIEELKNNK